MTVRARSARAEQIAAHARLQACWIDAVRRDLSSRIPSLDRTAARGDRWGPRACARSIACNSRTKDLREASERVDDRLSAPRSVALGSHPSGGPTDGGRHRMKWRSRLEPVFQRAREIVEPVLRWIWTFVGPVVQFLLHGPQHVSG